jgi:hypothetical protein
MIMKPLSLRRRKVRALRIFKHPLFRRKLPTPKVAQEALEFIRKNFSKGDSFLRLTNEVPKGTSWVRLFKFKGHEFVIKNTLKSSNHGHSTEQPNNHPVRKFIKLHHEFFRKNKERKKSSYILRTPKLFGIEGNYLLLEKIKRWTPKTQDELLMYDKARREMQSALLQTSARTDATVPQISDFIPAGIYKGKVVFYTVYDYL